LIFIADLQYKESNLLHPVVTYENVAVTADLPEIIEHEYEKIHSDPEYVNSFPLKQ